MTRTTLTRLSMAATCVVVVTLSLVTRASPADTITVWSIGSPHTGETPAVVVPPGLSEAAAADGFGLKVIAFPATDFAQRFSHAAAQNAAPDILVIDNFGLIEGITTRRGHFEGIGQNPALRPHLIKVTGSFDQLLGRQHGWAYLYALSRNHAEARKLALTARTCPEQAQGMEGPEIAAVASTMAAAYVEGSTLPSDSDPDRLMTQPVNREMAKVQASDVCGTWGNNQLAFVSVSAVYAGDASIGRTNVLLVLRNWTSQWRVLIAARDPVTNERFMATVPRLANFLLPDSPVLTPPTPATLLSPPDGQYPRRVRGQRFGDFTWRASPDAEVAEVGEFAYENDARLVASWPTRPGDLSTISAGQLWTTRGQWVWRIWSISRTGAVAFSDRRTFAH